MEGKETRRWFDTENITENKKRRKKIDAAERLGKLHGLDVIRRFVIAEAAAQKIHLADDEITRHTYSLYRQMYITS